MSSMARYLSSALSRLSFFSPVDSPGIPVTPRTPQSSLSSVGAPSLAPSRGLILSTSPYLKSAAADPKISLTPVAAADSANTSSSSFDISLSSDTSTSSSCSDDTLVTPLRSLDTNDLFSPRRYVHLNSSFSNTPSPPHLVGLGISGVPRRDGKPGGFDGLGLVGVRRSFNPRNPFLVSGEDDEDDDGYASPTPVRVHRRDIEQGDEQEQDDELSETFMRELVFTWQSDPLHTRVLSTIPECDDEDELEFQQAMLKKEVDTQPALSPERASPASSSPSSSTYYSTASPPSPLSTPGSPLTLHIATRPRATQTLKPTNQAKSELSVSRLSSRPHHSHTHSKSSSPTVVAPIWGRTITRAKNPSGLKNERDDAAVAAPRKKKPAVKGAWRT